MLACVRPQSSVEQPEGPWRVPITTPDYGAHPSHPDALEIGEVLALGPLPLADGGELKLEEALAAGPVVLVWVGGAEHEELSAWVQRLDGALPELDAMGVSLVFVRPSVPESALRWAVQLRLRSAVACDLDGELAEQLDVLRAPEQGERRADFVVLVLEGEGELGYRKLGGRRPEVEELGAVLEGGAQELMCCPEVCGDEPCAPSS